MKSPKSKSGKTPSSSRAKKTAKRKPKLLSGGNPQMAKAVGDAPVQD